MILNRIERINKAVGNFFARIGSEQEVDDALYEMLRNQEIDEELKKGILNAIDDLHVGNGLFLQQTYVR